MKTILITGGAGFIGSHLVEGYINQGYKVIVVDDLSSGSLDNLQAVSSHDNFVFYHVDICNKEALEKVFDKHKPHIINHHAAQKSVVDSVNDPVKDATINVVGLLNIISIIKDYPIENFIYVSSGGALSKVITGTDQSKESDPPQLESPYAITKYAGENYISLYAKLYGFNYSILRYANVYGPRQIPDGECGVIPIFMNNILADQPSVLMTYDDMPRGCTRDYINVKDVVDFNLLVTQDPKNDAFNLGGGIELPILDIYEKMAQVYGSTQPIVKKGPRLGDVKRSVLDNTKAKSLYGWQPTITLEQGLKALFNK